MRRKDRTESFLLTGPEGGGGILREEAGVVLFDVELHAQSDKKNSLWSLSELATDLVGFLSRILGEGFICLLSALLKGRAD